MPCRKIDAEVRDIIDTEYKRAYTLLKENFDKLELVAQTLLEVESLDAEEFAALVEGREPPRKRQRNRHHSRQLAQATNAIGNHLRLTRHLHRHRPTAYKSRLPFLT